MLKNVEVLYHSSIKINKEKIIYIDPFGIDKEYKDADIIFITHSHYDHFSKEDILKIKKEGTKIVATKDLESEIFKLGFKEKDTLLVMPLEKYIVDGIKIETVPAYNIGKKFHPKENNWVGYLLTVDNVKYYIAGDTDITEENKKVICDVCLLPVGGTYTMSAKEAANLANYIKPKFAVPTHYGSIVGKKEDGEEFVKNLNSEITGKILLKN